MFMLKDDAGRTVLLRRWRTESNNGRSSWNSGFYALDGVTLEPVEEAVISKGKNVFLTAEYVEKHMNEAGFGDLAWSIRKVWCGFGVHVHYDTKYKGWSRIGGTRLEDDYFIEGKKVAKEEYDRLMTLLSGFGEYSNLTERGGAKLRSDTHIGTQEALEMIGEGQRVTVKTLAKGKAIGDSRPRLLPGDTVAVTLKGEDVIGTVVSLNKKVSVLKKDGNKGSYAYSKVRRDATAKAFVDEMLGELEPTIAESFAYVLSQGARIYKAKLEARNASCPMFPDPEIDRYPREVENAPSCYCPICGWVMADFSQSEEFECSFCRIRGKVLNQTDDEVTLFMYRMPGKNRFAVKESRCCSNCGLFQFETGRQGKRSTGYCRYSNQCLQAYNVCDYWFPRKPSVYASNMKQHITNLGYGVSDRRNTDRNDIRDTIYREEDHEAEKQRAERAKVVYANAYEKFLCDMNDLAEKISAYDSPLDEGAIEEWKERLDDGC